MFAKAMSGAGNSADKAKVSLNNIQGCVILKITSPLRRRRTISDGPGEIVKLATNRQVFYHVILLLLNAFIFRIQQIKLLKRATRALRKYA